MQIKSILLWNVNSIRNKYNQLTLFLENNQIPAALITETWLKLSDNIHIPNYSIVRRDILNLRGGGVALWIHKNISYEHIPPPDLNFEYIAVKFNTHTPLVMAAVYIPPHSPIDPNKLKKLISLNPTSQFIIVGDFNARHISWNNRIPSGPLHSRRTHPYFKSYRFFL